MQVVSDFHELLEKLNDGTSEFCCFENHDILTENVVFDRSSDVIIAAKHIFVSQLMLLFSFTQNSLCRMKEILMYFWLTLCQRVLEESFVR